MTLRVSPVMSFLGSLECSDLGGAVLVLGHSSRDEGDSLRMLALQGG